MDVGTGVELEYSYGAGDGRTRSGVASMPKERSGGPRLDRSCDWEKYGYDNYQKCVVVVLCLCCSVNYQKCGVVVLCLYCSVNYQKCVVSIRMCCVMFVL